MVALGTSLITLSSVNPIRNGASVSSPLMSRWMPVLAWPATIFGALMLLTRMSNGAR